MCTREEGNASWDFKRSNERGIKLFTSRDAAVGISLFDLISSSMRPRAVRLKRYMVNGNASLALIYIYG